MKYGTVSPAVSDRCFCNVFRGIRSEAGKEGRIEEKEKIFSASSFPPWSSQTFVCSGALDGPFDGSILSAPARALNRLFCFGMALPEEIPEISLSFLLRPDSSEEELQRRVREICRFCIREGICISGTEAYVSDAAARDILTVSASLPKRNQTAGQAAVPERAALYMTGFAGDAGTSVIAKGMGSALKKRFSAYTINRAVSLGEKLLCPRIPENCLFADGKRFPLFGRHPAGEGGIFAALWEIGQRWKLGMEIDLLKIPVHQETIEICEFLQIHPYRLFTCGAGLMALEENAAEPLPETLYFRKEDCLESALRIGTLMKGKACILKNRQEVSFLEKPRQDSLYYAAQTGVNFF